MRRLLVVLAIAAASHGQQPADPRGLAGLVSDGTQALAAGRLDDLEKILGAAKTFGPDIRTEILRAELLIARKDAAGAAAGIAAAIRALKPAGELARAAHRTHARALVELSAFREAAPVLLLAVGLDKTAVASLALAARGLADGGDRRAARGLLALAVHLDPGRTDLLRVRAGLALEDGDPAAALHDAEELVRRAPADLDARRLRARALYALGRTMEARDALATIDRVSPLDATLLEVLGALDIEAGLLADAEAVLFRAGPSSHTDAIALARAWLDRGAPREALRVLDRVREQPEAAEVVRMRASAHVDVGEPARAAELLKTLASPTAQDQVALAEAERLAGNAAAAARILEPMLARDPDDRAARAGLIAVRVVEGDLAAARKLLDEGLRLAPHHAAFVRSLEDLVPELAPPSAATAVAVLQGPVLTVEGTRVLAETAAAVRSLRALRTGFGDRAPVLRLVLAGPIEPAALQRALDLLSAAGFSRIGVETR